LHHIFDVNGTLIKCIQDGIQPAGTYETVWDGKNSIGNKVGSGVYFFKIQANEFTQAKKMILLK